MRKSYSKFKGAVRLFLALAMAVPQGITVFAEETNDVEKTAEVSESIQEIPEETETMTEEEPIVTEENPEETKITAEPDGLEKETAEELADNSRSRSAKLRCCEKLGS